ncbi:type IV pilus modification protein PilV [Thiocystis violascens DSM 198]|uniref:Type IV pilus modification protein PilV n=2 Tax=Thiocystis violascens TaxID=73141 RepID=I3YAS1_THIV6|nr:type IV pilus modification protein PilV [Thiocystis violascens DSM 198]
MPQRLSHRQSGFTLLEVLIAVLVLGVGMLGAAALQISVMKNNQSSFQRTQAVMLSYFMLDAMRANRADAASENYDLTKTCTVTAAGLVLVDNDKHFWLQALKDNLGNAATTCGEIDCAPGATTCTVRIYWNDERGTGGSASQMFETSTRL